MQTRAELLAEYITSYRYYNSELTDLEITQEFDRIEAMTDREHLKWRISEGEKLKASYEALMQEIGMKRDVYGAKDNPEFYNWYKAFIRENLNETKHSLKQVQEEMYYLNQGLNPTYCYPTLGKDN